MMRDDAVGKLYIHKAALGRFFSKQRVESGRPV